MTPWLTRQVSIGILSSHFNMTIRSRSPSETGEARRSHGLDRIGYYLVAASGVTLSHSGTDKQEQTTFTERKRQGNMQDPVYMYLPLHWGRSHMTLIIPNAMVPPWIYILYRYYWTFIEALKHPLNIACFSPQNNVPMNLPHWGHTLWEPLIRQYDHNIAILTYNWHDSCIGGGGWLF